MMARTVPWVFMVLACAGLTACGSQTSPDPRVPPAIGRPTSMSVPPCSYGVSVTTCRAVARWGDLYSTTRDVTDTATWTSSDASVVRVTGAGTLAAVAPGSALVTISYSGQSTSVPFRVYANEPPWRACPPCEYHIQVRDAAGQRVGGVLVEIIGGHMQGRSAPSLDFGDAIFVGDIIDGPITVRATKSGFREWIGSAVLGGAAGNGQPGSETVGPVVMVAE